MVRRGGDQGDDLKYYSPGPEASLWWGRFQLLFRKYRVRDDGSPMDSELTVSPWTPK